MFGFGYTNMLDFSSTMKNFYKFKNESISFPHKDTLDIPNYATGYYVTSIAK